MLAGCASSEDAGASGSNMIARIQRVECEGRYPRHLQGICTDRRDSIYWCFTDELVRTDLDGRVIRRVDVADHHGDLCYHDGRVYVAVNLGAFNRPPGHEDSWVYVYDADSLEELARHAVPELVHGAGGMGYHDGKFIVIGGLPEGTDENYLYEYDESFNFLRRHVLPSGYTEKGIQTAAFFADHWWFGCYGRPRVLLKTDASFRLVGQYEFDCALGITGLPGGRALVGNNRRDADRLYIGWAQVAVIDEQQGLRLVEPTTDDAGRVERSD